VTDEKPPIPVPWGIVEEQVAAEVATDPTLGPLGEATPVPVPLYVLRGVFDVAVGSMNFSSGFLDAEEVEMLRRLAVIIGVDPREATPREFLCGYYGHERHGETRPSVIDGSLIHFTKDRARQCVRCSYMFPEEDP